MYVCINVYMYLAKPMDGIEPNFQGMLCEYNGLGTDKVAPEGDLRGILMYLGL